MPRKDPAKRKAYGKAYSQTAKGKANARARAKRYKEAHPVEFAARQATYRAKAEHREIARIRTKQWKASHKEETKQYMAEYHKTRVDIRDPRVRRVKQQYGLTIDEYERLYAQAVFCPICGVKMTDSKVGKRSKNLDHHHETGKVRGIICHNCNTGIGMLQDDSEILRRAADWCERE